MPTAAEVTTVPEGAPDRPSALDGRSAMAKRIKALASEYRLALGNPSDPLVRRAINEAAELAIAAEDIRQRHLAGDRTVTADDLIRASNCADRARRSLRLGNGPVKPPRPLRERLAEARA